MILPFIMVAIVRPLLPAILPALLAIPPLDPDSRRSEAESIMVGTVRAVSSREVRVEGGTNFEMRVTVRVLRVEKALIAQPPPETIEVRYWRPGKREPGWAGPQGQNSPLVEGTTVRLYLRSAKGGGWALLEPNGWEPAEGPPARAPAKDPAPRK